MRSTLVFSAGFAAGWLTRSAMSSSHEAAVTLLAFGMDTFDRIRRATAIERERFEDLVAEARAHVTLRRDARDTRARNEGNGAARHAA